MYGFISSAIQVFLSIQFAYSSPVFSHQVPHDASPVFVLILPTFPLHIAIHFLPFFSPSYNSRPFTSARFSTSCVFDLLLRHDGFPPKFNGHIPARRCSRQCCSDAYPPVIIKLAGDNLNFHAVSFKEKRTFIHFSPRKVSGSPKRLPRGPQ